ncbi:patatin-like phospholipase family protein [Agromyces mangrovi Wang et al. 2018]|uniref:patatin-like phospholipase family protein n=1 Tax=Agromyces mangrovi TaxID=1858653 RepID=UPI002573EE2F|nr:patatin-like phospholipase family protein [Agromyces mangrovi]
MRSKVAYVLGGGGVLGAGQVGMLRALLERDIRPSLIVGTSIGAVNGAIIAADVDASLERLEHAWSSKDARGLTSGTGIRLGRSHVMTMAPVRRLLEGGLGAPRASATSTSSSGAAPRASNAPPSTGSPAVPWCPRCSRRRRFPECFVRYASATSTSSTVGSSTRSRSARR